MLGCDVNVRVGAGRRSQSAVERKYPKTATRCGQRSEVVAVVTLTHLAGCMIAQRGMLRRPDGLLATVTQRAMEGCDGAQRATFAAGGPPVAVAISAMAPSGMACAMAVRVARGVVVGEVAYGVPFGEVLREHVTQGIGAVAVNAGVAVASVGADGREGVLPDDVRRRRSIVASMSSKAKARQQITHFKCLACAALVPNGQEVCTRCGYVRPDGSELCASVRERERAEARQNTKRRTNRTQHLCKGVRPRQ